MDPRTFIIGRLEQAAEILADWPKVRGAQEASRNLLVDANYLSVKNAPTFSDLQHEVAQALPRVQEARSIAKRAWVGTSQSRSRQDRLADDMEEVGVLLTQALMHMHDDILFQPSAKKNRRRTRKYRAYRPLAWRNEGMSGKTAYLAYYREQKKKGRTPAQIRAQWKLKKAGAKRRAQKRTEVEAERMSRPAALTERVVLAIYGLAEKELGHSDFLHEAGMLDYRPEGGGVIRVDLPRSRDTKKRKGWSEWEVDTPAFLRGLRNLQARYKKQGVKVIVAVNNPRQ